MKSKVIFKSNSPIDSFTIKYNVVTQRLIIPKLEEQAQAIGNELMEAWKKRGLDVFDGIFYRLDNIDQLNSGSKIIEMSTINYSLTMGYKELAKIHKLDKRQYTLHISVGSMLKTTDQKYIFGIRGKTNHDTNVDLVGGCLLKSEKTINRGKDVENHILKEIKEETNIDQDDIAENKFLGMLIGDSMSIIFIFETKLKVNSKDCIKIFNNHHDKELSDLLFIDIEKVTDFLKNQPSYRKILHKLF